MNKTSRFFLFILVVCLHLGLVPSFGYADQNPNIVVIVADDIGLGDISFHVRQKLNSKPIVDTPNIDSLAASGIWFTDAHSPTALCSPSRYAFMTGNYNFRSASPWGVWGTFRKSPIKKSDATIGSVAKNAGYQTAFIGKWHLGGDFKSSNDERIYRGDDRGEEELPVELKKWVSNNPRQFGFDYDFTIPCGVQGPIYLAFENGNWHPFSDESSITLLNKKNAKDPKFVSDKGPGMGDSHWDGSDLNRRMVEKATAFIKKHSDSKTPFLLNYWTSAVHIPHVPAKEIGGVQFAGTSPSPHLDMIRILDWEISQIVKALREGGRFENTLILFTSDNGGLRKKKSEMSGHLSSGGYRGSKNTPYEGGHRVPLIAHWPSKIKGGQESEAIINGTDLVATIAAVTGCRLKHDQAMDSFNVLPNLLDAKAKSPREELLLQAGSKNELIYRKGPWKLIIKSNHKLTKFDPIGLYNLEHNPNELESDNLLGQSEYQSRVETMLERYLFLRESDQRSSPLNGSKIDEITSASG